MKCLVIDAFSSNSTGRKAFEEFYESVAYACSGMSRTEVPGSNGKPSIFAVETLKTCESYVYAYERNEFTDTQAIKNFDRIDCIFISGDRRLLPWGKRTRALLLLVKNAFFTNKVRRGCRGRWLGGRRGSSPTPPPPQTTHRPFLRQAAPCNFWPLCFRREENALGC